MDIFFWAIVAFALLAPLILGHPEGDENASGAV